MQRFVILETQADLVERSGEVTQWSPERKEVEGDGSHWTIEARVEQFGKLGQVLKPSTVSKADVNSRTVSVADILLWGSSDDEDDLMPIVKQLPKNLSLLASVAAPSPKLRQKKNLNHSGRMRPSLNQRVWYQIIGTLRHHQNVR